jgi:hypothetical protein
VHPLLFIQTVLPARWFGRFVLHGPPSCPRKPARSGSCWVCRDPTGIEPELFSPELSPTVAVHGMCRLHYRSLPHYGHRYAPARYLHEWC